MTNRILHQHFPPVPSNPNRLLYDSNPGAHPNAGMRCFSYSHNPLRWTVSRKTVSIKMHLFIQFLANQPDYPNALDEWLTDVVARADMMIRHDPLDYFADQARSHPTLILTNTITWSDTPRELQWAKLHNKWSDVCDDMRGKWSSLRMEVER